MVCDASVRRIMAHLGCRLNPYSIGIWSATSSLHISMLLRPSLNPYSIGIWSATYCKMVNLPNCSCLNPYSIGIWSATPMFSFVKGDPTPVLILILLEYGLRRKTWVPLLCVGDVLILILLEYGLRRVNVRQNEDSSKCLNPYSIGIWSATDC